MSLLPSNVVLVKKMTFVVKGEFKKVAIVVIEYWCHCCHRMSISEKKLHSLSKANLFVTVAIE